jgi:hypothetical protein
MLSQRAGPPAHLDDHREGRSQRLARLLTIVLPALALLAWFVVPLFLDRAQVNHSRWEDPWKWDSLGARVILRALFGGDLFDGGRPPILSLLLGIGRLVALFRLTDPLAQRLLALASIWLVLFFGRETWGHLLLLFGVPADFHLHRLQAAFELFAVLLAAFVVAVDKPPAKQRTQSNDRQHRERDRRPDSGACEAVTDGR